MKTTAIRLALWDVHLGLNGTFMFANHRVIEPWVIVLAAHPGSG
jgi:hypothetical protein